MVRWAQAWHNFQLMEGKQPGYQLVVASYEAAKERFFGGNGAPDPSKRKPDPSAASRMTGVGSGTATAGSGNGNSGMPTLTRDQRRMADAMYPNVRDEAKRRALWWKEIGSQVGKDA